MESHRETQLIWLSVQVNRLSLQASLHTHEVGSKNQSRIYECELQELDRKRYLRSQVWSSSPFVFHIFSSRFFFFTLFKMVQIISVALITVAMAAANIQARNIRLYNACPFTGKSHQRTKAWPPLSRAHLCVSLFLVSLSDRLSSSLSLGCSRHWWNWSRSRKASWRRRLRGSLLPIPRYRSSWNLDLW